MGCTNCQKEITRGFVIGNMEEVFCSTKCLHTTYTPGEYRQMLSDGLANFRELENREPNGNEREWRLLL